MSQQTRDQPHGETDTHLDLNVARVLDELLDQQAVVVEAGLGLLHRQMTRKIITALGEPKALASLIIVPKISVEALSHTTPDACPCHRLPRQP